MSSSLTKDTEEAPKHQYYQDQEQSDMLLLWRLVIYQTCKTKKKHFRHVIITNRKCRSHPVESEGPEILELPETPERPEGEGDEVKSEASETKPSDKDLNDSKESILSGKSIP